ncbi:Zn(2)-C6 fungal-type domain-containing protein [Mycena sanguinolenta]|uniref:Zn(2)-C6 fungal-type domain-containing protein n=1 Tax=Mycena sanguinolenta TaxID=230812 RepID=A0A8H7DID9_9AGAR|nr:Zn(2)-C6 fungal-type domain-containing protein [Mycena sanguinolenta]
MSRRNFHLHSFLPILKNAQSVGDELKKENVELKAENAFLKTKLQSLALCSLCRQPLSHPLPEPGVAIDSSSVGSTPENVAASVGSEEPVGPEELQDATSDELAPRFSQITLEWMGTSSLGPGSSLALFTKVVAVHEKYLGRPLLTPTWRPSSWRILPWEKETYDQKPRYVYPDSDLIDSLLDDYFTSFHPTLPILHRPTFERSVKEGLHLTDPDFGATLLSVLAIASRYSNDPRVFHCPGVTLSSGWMFASQVQILPKLFPPTIYEVQTYCLLSLYALGTSVPEMAWFYLVSPALGSDASSSAVSTEDGLEADNRALNMSSGSEHSGITECYHPLSVLVLEQIICFCMGRPASIHIEDHDVELPLEVDDEYWDRGFVQPIGKPSELSYFIFHSRLCEILGDVMRRIYGSKRWKMLMGWDGPDWEQRTVAEFDSTMNNFLDSIPPHLKWDPENPPQGVFFDQSATLHISYQYLRISIHRPYIQRMTAGVPSLSICASAARTIIHTASIWLNKLQRLPPSIVITAVWVSGLILILNHLRAKREARPGPKNKDQDLDQVAKAMDILKFGETRLQPVGRLWEVLRELWILECPTGCEHADSSSVNGPDDGPFDLGNSLSSDQTLSLRPGISIEQLLADADGMNGIVDDGLMSMLMATSTDVAVDELKAENVTLKAENVELKAENALLQTKLRSLSLCSLCCQPLQAAPLEIVDDASKIDTAPNNGIASFDPEEPGHQDLTSEELDIRFSQITLQSGTSTSLGRASNIALIFNVVAWEKQVYDQRPRYIYPAPDLIASLLDAYFINFHPTFPILHRPSFERSVAEGLHLTECDFGATLLSVLAIASRYSNDSRIFVGHDVTLSSGWMFASQVQILPKLFPPTIYEVQTYCLLTLYALGTSVPEMSWFYLGLGIRCLQQREADDRALNMNSGSEHFGILDSTIRSHCLKLFRRSVLTVERTLCFCMGRPASIHIEDHDVDPLLEVDDEYWDLGFVQPIGKPSELSYFVFHLRLWEILGDVMRRIYGSKKWKILMGWNESEWEQRTVAEFDSAMNNFLDSIPSHLKWNPENPPQGVFFDQSAILHITYQYLQISIHRPYIQKTSVCAPSLPICVSAARAVIHTASIWLSTLRRVPPPILITAVSIAGIVLLLNMLRAKRTGAGLPVGKNKDKDLNHVAKAMDILKFAEARLQPVGRLWEVLRELWILQCPPNNEIHSPEACSSSTIFQSSSTDGHLQPGSLHFESSLQSSDQAPRLRPGTSIEQLLADTDPLDGMNSILDDELMSMLMGTSTDVANMDLWDAYVEDRNIDSATGNVSNGFVA